MSEHTVEHHEHAANITVKPPSTTNPAITKRPRTTPTALTVMPAAP
jgi:hypothetical protein